VSSHPTPFIHPSLVGKWISERSDIFQMDFLDEGSLASFARDRGVQFWEDDVKTLWQLKLLQADLVTSERKLRCAGLMQLGLHGSTQHLYADERRPRRRTKGWNESLASLSAYPSEVRLYFHPFRYYVLYHLDRMLKLNIAPIQMMSAGRYPSVLHRGIKNFEKWSSRPEFTEHINLWNNIVSLCVASEPCTYEHVFHSLKHPPELSIEEQRQRIREHWSDVVQHYREAGMAEIEKVREGLCVDAEMLDRNKDVHIMLRLRHGNFRHWVRGKLGGAMVLLTMAEIMRRSTEMAFDKKLREEDELGLGITPLGVKEKLYGSERILNGNRTVESQYLHSFGLAFGVRTRWYVEGDTEYGALDSILGLSNAIELVNLKGKIVEKGGKGLAFADSLRNDVKAQIFSVVLVDADNDSYVRVLRKAAEEDLMCGTFYLSKPDFEFHNFTLSELEEIIWAMAVENGADPETRKRLHEALLGINSGRELVDAAKGSLSELSQLSKGVDWGRRLIHYALQYSEYQDQTSGKAMTRPIIEAFRGVIRTLDFNYHFTRTQFKVDPISGRLTRRDNVR
jgi:hypothetical protein